MSLKQADDRQWCKCYFALHEKGTSVYTGKDEKL
jgi:hypothetical protein